MKTQNSLYLLMIAGLLLLAAGCGEEGPAGPGRKFPAGIWSSTQFEFDCANGDTLSFESSTDVVCGSDPFPVGCTIQRSGDQISYSCSFPIDFPELGYQGTMTADASGTFDGSQYDVSGTMTFVINDGVALVDSTICFRAFGAKIGEQPDTCDQ